jgi:hypothetical protein
MPRYIALFKAERDKVENYALALHIGKNIVGGLLDGVDRRQRRECLDRLAPLAVACGERLDCLGDSDCDDPRPGNGGTRMTDRMRLNRSIWSVNALKTEQY